MQIHLQMWMTYSANFSLIHLYFLIWLDPLPTIVSFANNSQNISFKNVVLILCLDFVATSLWYGNLLPWLQVSRSSRRKSMLSQCSGWEVLCLAFVSVNCILCLLCLCVMCHELKHNVYCQSDIWWCVKCDLMMVVTVTECDNMVIRANSGENDEARIATA